MPGTATVDYDPDTPINTDAEPAAKGADE